MTEKLKQLMHERAESVDFATPDPEAMARAGDRRVHRRKSLALVGGIAASAVLGVVAIQLGGTGTSTPDVAVEPREAAPQVWTTGSTLHSVDGGTTDLGHEVRSLVRTSSGYVFADRDGTVWSWVDGSATEVGRTDARYPRLVSDDEDDLAGWVDGSGDRPALVVLDQTTGSVERYEEHTEPGQETLADALDPVVFFGIDDGTAYWRDSRGAVAVDLANGVTRVVDGEMSTGFGIGDVENGLIAFTNLEGEAATVVGTSRADGVALDGAWGSTGAFSPDGRWYSSEGDEPAVFDTRSGERVTLTMTQRFATGYEWLDHTTLAVLAAEQPRMNATAQLLTCMIPDGLCEVVVADLGTFEELEGSFALPVGDYAG